MQILLLSGTVEATPHIRKILLLFDFFDCPVLSCPVLLFSGTLSGRTAEPIFTFKTQTTCLRVRKCLL